MLPKLSGLFSWGSTVGTSLKQIAANRLLKIRQQAVVIRDLKKYKAELEKCLARCREKGWDELSRERHQGQE